MRLALIAEESAGIQAIRMIAADPDHDLVVVFTRAPSDRRPATVAGAAATVMADVRSAIEVRTEGRAGLLRRLHVDVLLNVHGLNLVHPAVLAAPSIGSFNLHPGPLPAYAGLNAPSWAILNGEDHHAVTLHWMVAELDAGPVAYTTSFPLGADATGLSASLDCVRHGMPLIRRLLTALSHGAHEIPAVPQDLTAPRRRFGRDVPYAGMIPWHEPASRIGSLVRACDYGPFASPWGRPRTRLGRDEIEVLRARVVLESASAAPGTVVAACGDAAIVAAGDGCVAVERVQVDGEARVASDVLRIHRRLRTPTI